MTHFTRRAILGSTAAAAITVSAIGGWTLAKTSPIGLLRQTLERYLGPVPISNDELDRFLSAVTGDKPWLFPTRKLAATYEVALDHGITDIITPYLPDDDQAQILLFERRILGAFVSMTNYGLRSGQDDEVIYIDNQACINPYANLEILNNYPTWAP
ncbi:hypothetical protein [Croceicoccus sp. Ery15]|uniref:hypothetical protein n=1 Tax=Croceicoccus sp. Ery15 TaxID=1703338 RepID=UPI001E460880|nr:hypothetical protein [Croceicoccus sp. Ery15]